MEATELRIRNYVNVEFNGITIPARIQTFDDFKNVKYWQPIHLTEQWLLDFGAVKIDKDFYNLGEFKILHHINEDFKWTLIYKGITLINNIKHVHRLQNLYFALNNNELILNP